jgi:hypothetical protein
MIIGDPGPDELKKIEEYNRTAGFGNRFFLYFLMHWLGGAALLAIIYFCLRLLNIEPIRWVSERPTDLSLFGKLLAGVVIVVVGLVVIGLSGELLFHVIIPGLLKAAIGFLSFVDRNTPNGTMGLIGFGLITIGFMFQMYGTSAGAQRTGP